MRNWRANLPPDAPNQFLVNVLPDQVADANATLSKRFGREIAFRPMVRGRLVEVNGAAARHAQVRGHACAPARRARVQSLVDRHAARRQSRRRRASSGPRRRAASPTGMSLEDGIAQSLGVKLGDTLTFDIAGIARDRQGDEPAQGRLGQLPRELLRAVPAGPLDDKPATYIAAFRAPETDNAWLAPLVQKHPNILAIDVGELDAAGAEHRRSRVARDRVRVPVHARRRLAGAAGGRRGHAGRAQLRRRGAAHARRFAAAARSPRRSPSSCCSARWPASSRRPARRRSAGRSPIACSRFRSRPTRSCGSTASCGGAIAVTLAGWLGTRNIVRQPPLAVIRQLG